MAGLPAGVSALRLLCLQSIVHGGHAVALVQGAGFGEPGRRPQKTPRHSRESGAVDEELRGVQIFRRRNAAFVGRYRGDDYTPMRCVISASSFCRASCYSARCDNYCWRPSLTFNVAHSP